MGNDPNKWKFIAGKIIELTGAPQETWQVECWSY